MKKITVTVVALVLFVVVSSLAILAFGNPAWHKQIYLFQLYVWPNDDRLLYPPCGHTGRWIVWYPDGTKQTEMATVKGQVHGVWREWYTNGALCAEYNYSQGLLHGEYTIWKPEGGMRYLRIPR